MIETELELDGILVGFRYQYNRVEPEVGYLVDYWSWEVLFVDVCSSALLGAYDLLDRLSVDDLARIDNEIENYLNNK